MDKDLLTLLEQVGFNPKEAAVYLALLELGKGAVTAVAQKTGLKRSIIYVILENLKQKGYVTELPNAKIHTYQGVEPGVLLSEKKTTVKHFAQMLPLFQTLHNKGSSRPSIQYIETKEGILKTYEEMNYAKEAFFITSFATLEEHFPRLIEQWVKDYKKGIYKIKAKLLIPDNQKDKEIGRVFKKFSFPVKVLGEVERFLIDFTLYDAKLAISSLDEQAFMVIMESKTLTDTMRVLFEILWKGGKEYR